MLKTPSRARAGNHAYSVGVSPSHYKYSEVGCESCGAKPKQLCVRVIGLDKGSYLKFCHYKRSQLFRGMLEANPT